jgi:hypothetical protein
MRRVEEAEETRTLSPARARPDDHRGIRLRKAGEHGQLSG